MIDGHGDDTYNHADIRLNFSSNVYNHFAHDALISHLAEVGKLTVSRYPEPAPRRLQAALAEALGAEAANVMVTNGATEAIYLTAQALRGARTAILQPTFTEYADACRLNDHRLTFLKSLDKLSPRTDVVWLCNPNNPTGRVLSRETLLACMDRHPGTLFVVDASYAPFTTKPLLTPVEAVRLPQVVMLHSMTKAFAIPGLRLGFLTASATWVERIAQGRMPWSVNGLAQEAGLYLLRNRDNYRLPLDELLKECRRVRSILEGTGMCDVMPSDTHILLCRLHCGTAASLKSFLISRFGILIRDASNFEGLDDHYFRIAVQTPTENDELIAAIQSYMNQEF